MALVTCTAERIPRAAVIPGQYGHRTGQPTGRPREAQPKQIRVNVGGQAKMEQKQEQPELVGAR